MAELFHIVVVISIMVVTMGGDEKFWTNTFLLLNAINVITHKSKHLNSYINRYSL